MIYLHPQPTSAFLPLGDKKLSRRLTLEHEMWMKRFFKGPFYDAVTKIPATKYYLKKQNEWGKAESDLLLYEGK